MRASDLNWHLHKNHNYEWFPFWIQARIFDLLHVHSTMLHTLTTCACISVSAYNCLHICAYVNWQWVYRKHTQTTYCMLFICTRLHLNDMRRVKNTDTCMVCVLKCVCFATCLRCPHNCGRMHIKSNSSLRCKNVVAIILLPFCWCCCL